MSSPLTPEESSPLALSPMSWEDPSVTEELLAEMEEKEEQLLHAAQFGQVLLQRTEELQEDNDTITRVAEEHEYRARELQQNLDLLAEEAAEKDAELETAKLALAHREQEMEEHIKSIEGTHAEKEAMIAEVQEEAEGAKAKAAEEIARLKAQAAEILAREAEMREAREEEEKQRLALQKKQRETEKRLAKQLELQGQREETLRELEEERQEKQRLEEQLSRERKEAEHERKHAEQRVLLRSTAEFKQMRKQVAPPGQVFSPDAPDDAYIPQSPSLDEEIARQNSSERHKAEQKQLEQRYQELERKLAEARSAPPPSPGLDEGSEPEPEPEPQNSAALVLAQAKACICRGDEYLRDQETEAAVEQYDAGLQLIVVQTPAADETTVLLCADVPPQDADSPSATPLDTVSPDATAVRVELEEKLSRAKDLLQRKEDEFKLRMLLATGCERMETQQYSSALTAFREGLQCCSDHPKHRDIRERLRAQEAKAVEACAKQKQLRREERQRVNEATKSGWLKKKGDKFKNFKTRWFVLDFSENPDDEGCSRIEYFKHEGGDTKGVIELRGLAFEAVRKLETDMLQFWITTPDRVFQLLAPSFRERERWVAAIHWALDAERAREMYGDGTKYQEMRTKEEGMYVVLSVTNVAGDDPNKVYYEIRVRNNRRITSVTKRYSDFDELHTHLHTISEAYRTVLSGKVLSHDMGVTLSFLGAAGQGGGLEFPKKTWFEKGGRDDEIIAQRKEKLMVWLQRIFMIERLKDEPRLLAFIGAGSATSSGSVTVVTPREDRDAPPWESDNEFELIDATAELNGIVQQLILADTARLGEDADGAEHGVCMDNLVVTSVKRVHNKVLWEDFRRRQETIRQRGMREDTPQLGELPGLQQRLHGISGDATRAGGGGGAHIAGRFPRIVNDSEVNELRLWHGCTPEAAEILVQYGFGHGDRDGRYGAGDYFSDCSSTAQQHARATIHFDIQDVTGRKIHIEASPTDTVTSAKAEVYRQAGIPPEQQRIIVDGIEMVGEQLLSSVVIDGTVASLVLKPVDEEAQTKQPQADQDAGQQMKQDGSHTMLLCRVTCGAPYLTSTTHQGDRRPPPNAANHNLPFDCIFAEMGKANGGRQTHNEVVIFGGQQVYPELLIEYTTKADQAL